MPSTLPYLVKGAEVSLNQHRLERVLTNLDDWRYLRRHHPQLHPDAVNRTVSVAIGSATRHDAQLTQVVEDLQSDTQDVFIRFILQEDPSTVKMAYLHARKPAGDSNFTATQVVLLCDKSAALGIGQLCSGFKLR